jgi:hypothetical protein
VNRNYYAARIVELEAAYDYMRKQQRKQIAWLAIFVVLSLWCIGWAIFRHNVFMWFALVLMGSGLHTVLIDLKHLRQALTDCHFELDKLEAERWRAVDDFPF